MARRRRSKKKVNRKLLIILAVGAAVLIGAAGGWIFLRPRDPDRYYRKGERLATAGDLEGAAHAYFRAEKFSRDDISKNIRYKLAFADHLEQYATEDKSITREKARSLLGQRLGVLENILRVDPENAEAAERLMGTYWQAARYMGAWERFLKVAETRAKVTPDDPELQYRMALSYSNLGMRLQSDEHRQAAEAAFAECTQLAPNNPQYFLDWTRSLSTFNKPIDQIAEVFELAVEKNPDSARLLAAQARFLLTFAEDPEAAGQAFNRALEAPDKGPDDYIEIGSYYRIDAKPEKPADLEEALRCFRKALEIDPKAFGAYSAIANVLALNREREQAVQTLRDGVAAVETLRGDMAAEDLELDVFHEYVAQGTRLRGQLADMLLRDLPEDQTQRQEVLTEIEAGLEAVEKYLPRSIAAVRLQGQLAAAKGHYNEARKRLREAFNSTVPADLRIAEQLFDLYMAPDARLYGEAVAILKRVVVDYPGNVLAVVRLAELQLLLDQKDAAGSSLDHAGELVAHLETAAEDPNLDADRRATALAMAQRYRSQYNALQQKLKLMRGDEIEAPMIPENVSAEAIPALLAQARILRAAGRREEAMAICSAVVGQHPDNETAVSMLIHEHFRAGNTQQAEAVLLEALKHIGESPRLEFFLKVIRANSEAEREQLALEYVEQFETGSDKEWQLAMFHRSKGDREAYLSHLERALEIDPGAKHVVNTLFKEYLLDKTYDKVDSLIETAERAGMEPSAVNLLRARRFIVHERWDEAIAMLEQVVAAGSQSTTAEVLLGECHVRKGDLNAAEEHFNIAYQKNPASVSALVGLARLAQRRGRMDEHEEWVNRAYHYAPGNEYIRRNWMHYQELNEDPDKVIGLCERIRAYDPKDRGNLAMLGRAYMSAQPPRYADAEAVYRHLYESNTDPAASLAYLRQLAECLRKADKIDEGLKVLHAGAETQGEQPGYYGVVGDYLLSVGRIADARQAFEQMIAKDPNDYRGHQLMANLAYVQADWKLAVHHMTEAVRLRPERREGKLLLLELQLRGGMPDAAAELADEILTAEPNDLDVMAYRGRAAYLSGEMDLAMKLYTRALEVDPKHLKSREWRFDLHRVLGRVREAVEDLRQAFEIDPSPRSAVRLANYYEGINDLRSAQSVLEEALRLHPTEIPLMVRLTESYLKSGLWEPLESVLRAGREQEPELATWWIQEAKMWRERKDTAKRVEALATAHNMAPNDTEVILAYLTGLADAGRNKEVLATSKEIVDKATSGGKKLPRGTVVAILPSMARAQLALGDEKGGLTSFRRGFYLCQGAEAAELAHRFGQTLGTERSVKLLTEWLAQRENWATRAALASQLQKLGKASEAREVLAKTDVTGLSQYARMLIHRQSGVLAYVMADYEAAEQSYRAALAIAPMDVTTLNNFAYLLAEHLNRPDEALEYARRAASIAPTMANVADTVGWVSFLAGDMGQARNHLFRAVELGATGESRYHLGRFLEAQNRTDEAREQYQLGFDTVKDTPENPMYEQLQARLRSLARP